MMEKKMFIDKTDIEEILMIMNKFPEAKNFELVEEGGSGIGTVVTLIIHTEVNGIVGSFSTEISGIEDW
jgi:hypothetical protein